MSSLALRQPDLPAAAAWISIAEAAARSGIPERTLRRRCRVWGNMGRANCTRGEWRIDPAVDEAFLRGPSDDARAELLDLRQVSAGKRAGAAQRRQVLKDLESWIGQRMTDGDGRTEAIAAFAQRFSTTATSPGAYGLTFSVATLYKWLSRAKLAPVSGLVDRRGLAGGGTEPDADVIRVFAQRYLSTNRPSLRSVWEEVCLFADARGLRGWGSYATFRRWVRATYPQAAITLNRDGVDAYHRRHEPSIDQDPENFYAGEMYVGDHHQFRCVVRYRGQLIRPWLTAWMDQRSLTFVGYLVVPSPNQCTILSAYKHAAQRYGISKLALMDNGRDYSGHAVSGGTSRRARRAIVLRAGYLDVDQVGGLFGLLGVETHFAIPKRANSKIIEGLFRPIEERFVRNLPNYCGADIVDKPQAVTTGGEGSFEDRLKNHPEAFPEFEQFAADVATWIDSVYHHRAQDGRYCNGASPAEIWQSRSGPRPELRDPRVLDLMDMVWSQPVTATRKGIRFANLHYGAWDPRVIALHGQKVLVSYNPADVGSIGIWTVKHEFIARIDQNVLAGRGATDENQREAHRIRARLARAMKVVHEDGHLRYADNAQLTLAAQQKAIEQESKGKLIEATGDSRLATSNSSPDRQSPVAVRLIQTPLDGQVSAVRRAFDKPAELLANDDDLMQRLRETSGETALSISEFPIADFAEPPVTIPAFESEIGNQQLEMLPDDLMRRLTDE